MLDHEDVGVHRPGQRTWRVRAWIRVAAVLVLALLLAEQWDIVGHVRPGEFSPSEARDGWIFLAACAVVLGCLAFRPRVTLTPERSLLIQNPIRRWVVDADRVSKIYFGTWGLVLELDDGRKPWTIIFQDTAGGSEPRWFDVAEAVTGVRPDPIEDWDDDDWADHQA